MPSRRFGFAVLLLVAALGCTHADGTSDGKSPAGKKFRIAMIPKGTSHEFWKSVEAGARKAEKEFGVEIAWKGPTGEGDTGEQIRIVENFLAGGYDGICLAPLDGIALRKPVDEVLANKIPVVIFDSALTDSKGITSFVATNNYRAGQLAGAYLAELLAGKGRIIMMRYEKNSVSTEDRERGFLDAIAKFKEITILSSDKHSGAKESDSVTLGGNLLVTYGAQLDGIFCPNESTTSGMLTALESAKGMAGKVEFVGFDSGDNIARGLKTGHLMATVLQDPVQMGYDAVRVMTEKLQGKPVPERIEVPETLVTTKNLNEPKIQALLFPAKH